MALGIKLFHTHTLQHLLISFMTLSVMYMVSSLITKQIYMWRLQWQDSVISGITIDDTAGIFEPELTLTYSQFIQSESRDSAKKRYGKPFNVEPDMRSVIKPLIGQYFDLNKDTVNDYVFITANSHNHFQESKDAVASIQAHFPNKSIYYFDIGLREEEVDEVHTWLNVKYRKFDFSRYPQHVEDHLRMPGWKAAVIQELFHEKGAVLWFDASIRFHTSSISTYTALALDNGGVALFRCPPHSVFCATHAETYKYFPSDLDNLKKMPMCLSGVFLLYNTREIFTNILYWWWLCAMDVTCCQPMRHYHNQCRFQHPEEVKWRTWAGCHKYDQSTLNILLANHYGFAFERYVQEAGDDIVTVERTQTNHYRLKFKQNLDVSNDYKFVT